MTQPPGSPEYVLERRYIDRERARLKPAHHPRRIPDRVIGWARGFALVDQRKVEAVRVRLVKLLGRETTARLAADVGAVEYQLAGLWADLRLERQKIRISRERFEKHQRPDQVFPPEALFYATNGRSFLLTGDGGIVPHAD